MKEITYSSFEDSQFLSAMKLREDLEPFKENKIAALAIELCFGVDDSVSTLLPAVTGSGGDAKMDMIFVSREMRIVVICQAYMSNEMRKSAKGNKGTDLSYAMNVLLHANESQLNDKIKPQVMDARSAIKDGEIKSLYVWYVHNCPESEQIKQDMSLAIPGSRQLLNQLGGESKSVSLHFNEVGLETLDSYYRSSLQSISVSEEFLFDTPRPGFLIENQKWKSFMTYVSGDWLASLYRRHGDSGLYNPNVRGFMGANNKDTDKVINAGIQESADKDAGDFFVFNNGITALVHDFTLNNDCKELVSIKGIGIVNGAQTTGSLGELDTDVDLTSVMVGVRFIKCEDKDTVKSITKYNNSQNKVIQSDFRANDIIQTRLREEFSKLRIADYDGGLRGYSAGSKKRKIDAHTAAQALTAWHGSPYDSYHNKMKIWDDAELYNVAFDSAITAKHLMFVSSLNDAVNLLKVNLQLSAENEMTAEDIQLMAFLNERGSSFIVIHAMARMIETFIGSKIISPYGISFKSDVSKDKASELWILVIKTFSRFMVILKPGLANRLSNKKATEEATSEFVKQVGTAFDFMKSLSGGKNPIKDFVSKIENKI
ncbi:AIPR family protein [Klebsiella pneumoniae]